jgi:hypothetical protein
VKKNPRGDEMFTAEENCPEKKISEDNNRILAEMAGITDSSQLVYFALNSKEWAIRKAALDQIEDDVSLEQIVMKSTHMDDCFVALQKIHEEEVLWNILWEHKELDVRMIALSKIVDPDKLVAIAKQEEADPIQHMALKRIEDQDVLEDLALTHSNVRARESAITKLNRSDALVKVIKKESFRSLRVQAYNRVPDKELLEEDLRRKMEEEKTAEEQGKESPSITVLS